MPDCPHCHEHYFGNPDLCPKCYYDFKAQVVKKPQSVIDNELWESKQQQQRRHEEIEQRNIELERAKKNMDDRALALMKSPRYEYQTEYLTDSKGGMLDKSLLQSTLVRYANDGWRLHTIFTNEIGKNVDPAFVGTRNATIEVTILVFERCIKLADE